MKYSTAFQYFV